MMVQEAHHQPRPSTLPLRKNQRAARLHAHCLQQEQRYGRRNRGRQLSSWQVLLCSFGIIRDIIQASPAHLCSLSEHCALPEVVKASWPAEAVVQILSILPPVSRQLCQVLLATMRCFFQVHLQGCHTAEV